MKSLYPDHSSHFNIRLKLTNILSIDFDCNIIRKVTLYFACRKPSAFIFAYLRNTKQFSFRICSCVRSNTLIFVLSCRWWGRHWCKFHAHIVFKSFQFLMAVVLFWKFWEASCFYIDVIQSLFINQPLREDRFLEKRIWRNHIDTWLIVESAVAKCDLHLDHYCG